MWLLNSCMLLFGGVVVNVQRMLYQSCTRSCITAWAAQSTAKWYATGQGRLVRIARRHLASDQEHESMSDDLIRPTDARQSVSALEPL